jgi:drug/metabolite transporter (DMT)-like permease
VTPVIVGLVLAAAFCHASWNALLRGRTDRLWSMTVMSFVTTAAAIPAILLLPLPAQASWPYIAVSAALQTGYSLVLVRAYRSGEFAQVYPIARGSAPLLATLGAALVAGEVPSPAALVGVALVSAGILAMARPRGGSAPPVAPALATGAFIASYLVCDGIGSRLAGSALAYIAWILVIYGVVLPAIVLSRGKPVHAASWPETLKAAGGGLISIASYGTVVWAISVGPVGPVAALRETSILFAAALGRIVFGERLTAARLAACAVIAGGAVCLGVAK